MASSEPVPQTVAPGDILADRYRVERVLGQGGMGVVVAARDARDGARVAIKCLLPNVVGNADLVTRFLREARTASLIASEHVTRVLDVGTREDGSPFIVMEYLEGRDLASILRERGRMEIADAVDYALQACEALAVAHSAGIVHRDLKPANLFLTELPDGAPLIKILDFGISKKHGGDGDFALTRTDSAIMGSPAYISPEQIRSQKRVDGRADIWSLGVTLFELLSGQLPFMAETLGGLMAAILADPPLPLRSMRADVPAGLEAVVHGCLEKSVAARPANVALLAQALRPFGSARGAASVERTTGVVVRTTGGSLTAVQAVSVATPRAAPPPARFLPEEATTTRPLGTSLPVAGDRDARPRLPSAPVLAPEPVGQAAPPRPASAPERGPWSDPEETRTIIHPGSAARAEVHEPQPARSSAVPAQEPAPPAPPAQPYRPYSSPAAGRPAAHPVPAVPAVPIVPGAPVVPAAHAAPAVPVAPSAHISYPALAAAAEAPARRPPALWIGVGAGLLVTLVVGWLAMRGGGETEPASSEPAAARTSEAAASAGSAAATSEPAAPSGSPSLPASAAPTADPSASASADPAAPADPSVSAPSAAPAASAASSTRPQAHAKPGGSPGAGKARPGSTSDLNKLIQNRK